MLGYATEENPVTPNSDIATRENATTTKPSRHREHNNYSGNQFNIESIVLNVNAPSKFGIASAGDEDSDEEEEEAEAVADDRIGRDEVSGETSPFESVEYDYDAGTDSR